MALTFALTNKGEVSQSVTNVISLSYGAIMMLPSMAVAVRRLHDLGKSGWMLLIVLIPIVGGIWMFVLMVTEGQQGKNEYGTDPKTSPETFGEQERLKSAAVTLIIAATVGVIFSIAGLIDSLLGGINFEVRFLEITFMRIASNIVLLIAGVWLLDDQRKGTQGKRQKAILMLLLAVVMFYVMAQLFTAVTNLFVAILALTILFSSQNKNLIRYTAVTTIVILCINIFWSVLRTNININFDSDRLIDLIISIFRVFSILQFVAYMVLAGAFLSKKEADEGASVLDL